MPKVFMVEPAEKNLDRITSELDGKFRKNCKQDDNKRKISQSINQSVLFDTHNTIQAAKCMKRKPLYDVAGIMQEA